MNKRWTLSVLTLTCAALIITGAGPKAGAPTPPTLTTLEPGGFKNITQTLPINIVFLGYDPGAGPRQIDGSAFDSLLPSSYRPIHRYPAFYGIRQEMGLTFNFTYNKVFTDAAYENAFFGYLTSIAVPQPMTLYQNQYFAQAPRALANPVPGGNYWIDGPSVEKWLADNPPPGVNTSNYTVYFVNWFDRPDFRHHVYVKTNEPDPDTGYNFGVLRASRKMIAWGGTAADDAENPMSKTSRVWFYDLSAGPELWTNNWDITRADVDGDGVRDYRMPPVWEYGNPSPDVYRAFDNLSRDLSLITRFVAIDLLFTTSPLYKPMISPPNVPTEINVDFNLYQADPGSDAQSFLNQPYFRNKLSKLQPVNQFTSDATNQLFAGRAADVYRCFVADVSCFGQRLFGIAFADLFLYHEDHLTQFLEGDGDYEVPVFLYNTTNALSAGGLLGFADDNWRDGTQSFVFGFLAPFVRAAGYGFTTTSIHEVGHHLGMSHPHDGYDSGLDADYFNSGFFYFANSGDESNSMMSYIDLNWDFSQFDRDNMGRYLTIGYINQANLILKLIYASPRAGDAAAALSAADAQAAGAISAYQAMNYPGAALRAKQAFNYVMLAAQQAGVQVEPQNYTADYKAKAKSPKFIDTVDYDHRLAP